MAENLAKSAISPSVVKIWHSEFLYAFFVCAASYVGDLGFGEARNLFAQNSSLFA